MKKKFVYNHSIACKPPDVEEIIDIYINRKIAAPFVKLLLNTRVTPNQVTIMSLFIGIGSAWLLSINHRLSPLFFAIGIYLALILDCVDGQLARATDRVSLSGRILDGTVDYLNAIAYFAGIVYFSFTYSHTSHFAIIAWSTAGALSMLAHSILYDLYRQDYITYTIKDYPEKNYSDFEIEKEYNDAVGKKEYLKIVTIRIYRRYVKLQHAFSRSHKESIPVKEFDEDFAALYRSHNRTLIRLWSWIGSSSHLTGIIIASIAAYYKPDVFLYCFAFFTVVMNPFMIIVFILQLKALRNLSFLEKR